MRFRSNSMIKSLSIILSTSSLLVFPLLGCSGNNNAISSNPDAGAHRIDSQSSGGKPDAAPTPPDANPNPSGTVNPGSFIEVAGSPGPITVVIDNGVNSLTLTAPA